MSFYSRVYSQVYKNMKLLRGNMFRLADLLVWPLTLLFMVTLFLSFAGDNRQLLEIIIMGAIGWRVLYFLNIEMVFGYVEEYWHGSLAHLLLSPINRTELALGGIITGLLKATAVTLVYLVVTRIAYGFEVSNIGMFLLALSFLAVNGMSIGLFTLGLQFMFKRDAFALSFIIADILVLLSGVYYSVDVVFPEPLKSFVQLFPTTHAFNMLKSVSGSGTFDMVKLVILTAVWLLAASLFNKFMFDYARKKGELARLG